MKSPAAFVLLAVTLAALCVPAGAAFPRYNVVDLGTLGGVGGTSAGDINNHGQVVGYSKTAGGATHAYIWELGTGMTDLGTLGGSSSYAYGINDAGQVAGKTYDASEYPRAFLWQAGAGMSALDTPGPGAAQGYDINNSGVVTGRWASDPCIWTPGVGITALSDEMGYGLAINDLGQVAGQATFGDTGTHAFYWQPGSMIDLGTLGGFTSSAEAINNSSQVVGYSENTGIYDNDYLRAFIWQPGQGMMSLGTLGGLSSSAGGINNLGWVTGSAHYDSTPNHHGFLWEAGTGMVDLNTLISPASGWVVTAASVVNDRGWILASGSYAGGGGRAIALIPVPEPSGLLVVAAGALAVIATVAYRRRRGLEEVA